MMRWFLRVARAFPPAFAGLGWALKTQCNVRIHAAASMLVAGFGVWLKIAPWEWCAVILATGIVWSAELLNTAIEALADRVSTVREEAIRRVKDVAAAAVLMAAFAAVLVALIIFVPKLWLLL